MNFKIHFRSSSQPMADREKKRGEDDNTLLGEKMKKSGLKL